MAQEEPTPVSSDNGTIKTDTTTPHAHTDTHKHTPKKSVRKGTRLRASFLLFLAGTFIGGYVVVIVLNLINRLPPHVADFLAQIFGGGGLLAIVVTVIGLFNKEFYISVWQNAYRFFTILLSMLVVTTFTLSDVWFLSPPLSPTPTPYPPFNGVLKLNDPLKNNDMGHVWFDYSPGGNATKNFCHFRSGGYLASISVKGHIVVCGANNTEFDNFVYEVQITIVQGDNAGIVFRGAINDIGFGTYYIFWIGANGHFDLFRYNTSGEYTPLFPGSPPSRFLHTGQRVTNTIAVAAHGDDIDLFINGYFVEHAICDLTTVLSSMDKLWVNDKLGQHMGQNCFVVHQPENTMYAAELKRTFAEG